MPGGLHLGKSHQHRGDLLDAHYRQRYGLALMNLKRDIGEHFEILVEDHSQAREASRPESCYTTKKIGNGFPIC